MPGRWARISEYVASRSSQASATMTHIGPNRTPTGRIPKTTDFVPTSSLCKKAYTAMKESEPSLLEPSLYETQNFLERNAEDNGHKGTILVPPVKCPNCVTEVLPQAEPRPSFPLIYTLEGTRVAASFHSTCVKCTAAVYSCFYDLNGERFYFDLHSEFFLTSSATAFATNYLRHLGGIITFSHAPFQALADAYNHTQHEANHRPAGQSTFGRNTASESSKWNVNELRLEYAWFLFNIVTILEKCNTLRTTAFKMCRISNRVDLEAACQAALQHVSLEQQWLSHRCAVKGCAEGYVTIDGNAKIRRTKCAAPSHRINLAHDMPSIMDTCPASPRRGGKNSTPSKFCQDHENTETVTTVDLPDLRSNHTHYLRSTKNMPPCDTVACKSQKKVEKFYTETAGVLAMVRPCGMIVSTSELFTSESSAQVFAWILRTCSADWSVFKYIGYDRACELHPYLVNLSQRGNLGAREILDNCDFLVDIFHVLKHTKKTCMPLDGNEQCRYHPHLDKFKTIRGTNTECAEQAFSWLSLFKRSVKRMSRYKFLFFLYLACNRHNQHVQNRSSQ